MPTVEDRVSVLEGRVGEHSKMINGLREAVASLEHRMDRRFELVDQRLAALEDKMDRRFIAVDQRFAAFEDKVDRRFEAVDQRFNALDQKLSRHFLWLVGIVLTAMAAMIVRGGG